MQREMKGVKERVEDAHEETETNESNVKGGVDTGRTR